MTATAWAGAAAAAVGLVLSGLIARVGPVDAPETGAQVRTSHARPTPTSGGLAIIAGTGVGLAVAAAMTPGLGPAWRPVGLTLAMAGGLGLFGALDDIYDFGARPKLLLQAVVALAFAVFVARIEVLPLGFGMAVPIGPVIGALGTALWIVVAANAMNFMDGANGVAPGAAVVVFAALAIAAFGAGAPAVGAAALAAAAAGAGFLPWNLGGRLFQGDTGSVFSGFLFAALSVLAARRGGEGGVFLYFGPVAFLPFLTDVLLTLLARARGRRPLLQAHREHLYQLWLGRSRRTHLGLAWRVWLVMALFCALALATQNTAATIQPLLFAASVIFAAGGWFLARRRLNA